jgi:predicted N-acyltransferase
MPQQQRVAYLRHLIEAIEHEAKKRRLSLFFTNVSEKESELCKELQERKYNLTAVHPKNRLEIKWLSYADYMSDRETVSRKDYETFKSHINKNRKAGVNIRLLDDLENEKRLYQLVSEHHYRLNKQPFPYTENFFSSVRQNLGSDAMLLVAERDGEIIGITILFQRGSEGWATFIGMEHNLSRNDFTYFNLAYYRTIDYAIQAGIKSLNYGGMLYRVKKRRGCTLEENYIYHKASARLLHNLLRPWFLMHMTWYIKRKIPKMVSRQ